MRIPLLITCAAMLLGVAAGSAQTTDANLVGTIVDASGGGIPGADVSATNTATHVKTPPKRRPTDNTVSTTYRSASTMLRPGLPGSRAAP